MLKIVNISKSFGDTEALHELSFSLSSGTITGLLGLNGAGKTTTIRILLNIIKPSAGNVYYNDSPIDSALYKKTGYLPEERGLYQKALVKDVLLYLSSLKGLSRDDCLQRCDALLKTFNATDLLTKNTNELSKGNQQIIQLILALIHEPEILILDEPFTGFDPQNQEIVHSIIKDYANRGNLVLLSTHLMNIAEKLCDDILFLHRGELIFNGSLSQLEQEYKSHSPAFDSLHSIFMEKIKTGQHI